MKRILRHPATNASCLSLFTAFYAILFWAAASVIQQEGKAAYEKLQNTGETFFRGWCAFLAAGHYTGFVFAMVAITVAVVVLLVLRRCLYDEYQTALLVQCLIVSTILILVAVAVFFMLMLANPAFVIVKFTLFISIHWLTVVLADLAYVLLCRWR